MYDFKKVEQNILSFWKENKIFEKSLLNRQQAKRFVFFEGPPTANGKPGIHHFLGRAFKDLFCRYKTMRGFYVLRKAGWDTHGLPVELEIEKELGFKNKKDIEKFGIAEFNKKAKASVWKYKTEWEEMTRRTGFWLDTTDPYITYENKYIESLWAIIKKIWDKKLLYLAHRVVPFCTRCGTAFSSHEVAQGYKKVSDKSVYVKFKLKPNNKFPDNTYILAWTTTPWTLPGNVALAVGKDIDYILVDTDRENGREAWIIARDIHNKPNSVSQILADQSVGKKIYNIEEIKGSELVGLEYEPLFDIKELKSDKSYRIYDADFVSTTDGTGVVHTAVMYGEDDYNLGTKLGLTKFHTVNQQGRFVNEVKELAGMYVKESATEDLIIEKLKSSDNLLKTEDHEHDYPFCWRCDTPLLYYAKESWFIKMSAVRDKILKNNSKINWAPEHIQEGRFGQWLKEGKDWAFSRERYWGTPLPLWKCQNGDCKNFKAVGSMEDLEKYRFKTKNEFFILRHGHSEKNGKEGHPELISSMLENDKYHLTDEGEEQIKKVAKKIKKLGGVDLIFASPFIRTQETAHIVAKEIGLSVHTEPLLGEFKHGPMCEGKIHSDCVAGHMKNQEWETKLAEGESWKDVRKRISGFLRDLDLKHSGKKILIVSHGDPLWLLETFALGLEPKEAILSRSGPIYPGQGELKKIELKNWPYDEDGELDLHRPYIDQIELKCDKCGSKMVKVPDLIDVWFDSGAMPFAQWHWPFDTARGKQYEKEFKSQFPAEFITEAIDQTRGWFYTLLAVSTLLDKGPAYKNVLVYSHVLDEKGQKMSKSKGNVVSPFEVVDKFGADTARWYFYTINSPGDSKLFSMKDVELRLKGFITTLDNCVRFYELYAVEKATWTHDTKPIELLDRWILSKLHGLVDEVTKNLDDYNPTTAARAIEKFVVEDFSNWWLRRSRKRKEALSLLRFILLHLVKVLAPFTPFIAEDIKSRLHKFQKAGHESVHLNDWPEVDKKLIDKKLEGEMEKVREAVAKGLALRKEKQIKVRQPLAQISTSFAMGVVLTKPEYGILVRDEVNVKNIVVNKDQSVSIVLDTELTQPLIYEGYARELMRQIQDMRKEAKYRLDDRVFGQWHSDSANISEAIRQWSDKIKEEVLLSEFKNSPHGGEVYDIEKECDLAPQMKIWVGIKNKKAV